jgi:flagellar assembly factor FliW
MMTTMTMQETTTGHEAIPAAPPAVVTFREGFVGIPEAKRFAIESSDEIAPLLRIRCLDKAGLSFLVVDPRLVEPGYRPELEPKTLSAVGLTDTDGALLLAVAHISPKAEECTANLLAPLVINPESLSGVQVILDPRHYSTRHRLVDAG